jgi:hypothetical protein
VKLCTEVSKRSYLQENIIASAIFLRSSQPSSILGSRIKSVHYPRRRTSLAGAGTSLLGLAATSATSVHLALNLRISTDVLECSSVLEVAVDTSKFTTVDSGDTLDVDVTRALLGALPSL